MARPGRAAPPGAARRSAYPCGSRQTSALRLVTLTFGRPAKYLAACAAPIHVPVFADVAPAPSNL